MQAAAASGAGGTTTTGDQKRIRFQDNELFHPHEATTLILNTPSERPILVHRDSEFTVSSEYDDAAEHNTLNAYQGAALLTADCLGTGLLALPNDIHELGKVIGLGFLIATLPINYYAGYIFHKAATAVEIKQQDENRAYSDALLRSGSLDQLTDDEDDNNNNNEPTTYQATDTVNTASSMFSIETMNTQHSRVHHDTSTFDFIGMTVALFRSKKPTRFVMITFYINIFLVLGNYILVMSHAVAAMVGEERICLPTAGLFASVGMFFVSQSRTMARLGRAASIVSLSALFIVLLQCLWEVQQRRMNFPILPPAMVEKDLETGYMKFLRKLSALGAIGFATGSQKLFLNIRHELADRSDAPISLGIALVVFGMCYVLLCLAAGPDPPGFLLDAIPQNTWNRHVAGFLLWIHVIVSYAINSQAICSSIDRLMWRRVTAGYVRLKEAEAWVRWMILSGIMAIFSYTVANSVPFFKDLVAFIGAATSVPLTLLFPAIFWRKHLNVPLFRPASIGGTTWSLALVYFSVTFMVVATVGSLYSIKLDWAEHGAPFSCH